MSQIKQIKDAINIVDIIAERIELQRSGSNLRARCPFHSEKTPSFFVNETLQRYRCFGCGEAGDVFTFLEKYEGMTFTEGLRYLADRTGIVLESFTASPEDDLRDRLLQILDLARNYYHFLLTKHQTGEAGRAYVKQRGITQESVKVFQIGYALPSWDGLFTFLHQKKGFSVSDIEKTGLVVTGKTGRPYDRFRGRLMFPLTNHRGQVVGFSGRVLEKDVKEAKYINTPETTLYHKSELLFGFSQLYQEIRKAGELIVAEGELDVISAAQAHVNNIVAIKGSALTQEQLQLIRRTANRVLLALDMDSAGREATKRAISLAKEYDIELRVIQLPGGKDPDELARTDPKALRDAVGSSISVYEFFLQTALKENDQSTPEGKRKIIDELAPILGEISHAVEQDFYLKKLALALQVKEELVRQDILKFKDKGKFSPAVASKPKVERNQKPNRRERLEGYLLFLLLRSTPEEFKTRVAQLTALSWQKTGFSQIIKALAELNHFNLTGFMKNLAEDLQQIVTENYLNPEFTQILETADLEKEWQTALKEATELSTMAEIAEITEQLNTLDDKTEKSPEDEQKQAELLKRIVLLKRQQ